MNQEKLADLLADHLDLVLEEKQLPATPPAEIAPLLEVAEALAATAPVPRPEFGPTLKESLLGPTSGGNGRSAGTAGAGFGGHLLLVVVVGLLALAAGLALLVGTVIIGLTRSSSFDSPSPMLLPVQAQPAPAQATQSPAPPPSPTVPVTPDMASDSFSPPVMATVVLDILPAITNTVETAKELPLPSDLSSGQSTSDDGDSGGGSSGGHRGDHDRGHGNDPDRHDDDNPGHSK